jgi:hypothetical protein
MVEKKRTEKHTCGYELRIDARSRTASLKKGKE